MRESWSHPGVQQVMPTPSHTPLLTIPPPRAGKLPLPNWTRVALSLSLMKPTFDLGRVSGSREVTVIEVWMNRQGGGIVASQLCPFSASGVTIWLCVCFTAMWRVCGGWVMVDQADGHCICNLTYWSPIIPLPTPGGQQKAFIIPVPGINTEEEINLIMFHKLQAQFLLRKDDYKNINICCFKLKVV